MANYIDYDQATTLFGDVDGRFDGIEEKIPSGASSSNKLATASDIPDALADLTDDSTHRVVTDTEKTTWSGKQDALTFDNTPTANSNNPVKSGGIKTAIENSFSASETEIKDTVGWVGKNKLEVLAGNKTQNDVAFTKNADSSITINTSPKASAQTTLSLRAGVFTYPYNKDMILSGAEGGSESTYEIYLYDTATSTAYRNRDGNECTIPASVYGHNVEVMVVVRNNAVVDNVTVYPMLRDASITDPTYEPYYPSVEEVVEQVYAGNGVLGAKNLIKYPYRRGTTTLAGITFTDNKDGTLTLSGTASDNADFYLESADWEDATSYRLPNGRYIARCEGTNSNVKLYLGKANTSAYYSFADGNDHEIVSSDDKPIQYIFIRVNNGTNLSTPVTIKPMLRLASDPDSTYAPYAMTNKQLTEMMTVEESALTNILSGATVGDIGNHLYRYGKLVIANVRLNNVTATAWTENLGIIPEGYRPSNIVRCIDCESKKMVQFNVSGSIKLGENCSNSAIVMMAAWIIA